MGAGCTTCEDILIDFQIYAPRHASDSCRAVISGPNASMAYDVAPYCDGCQDPQQPNDANVIVPCPGEQDGGLALGCSRSFSSLYLGTTENRYSQEFFDALGTTHPSMTVTCNSDSLVVRGGAEDDCPR